VNVNLRLQIHELLKAQLVCNKPQMVLIGKLCK